MTKIIVFQPALPHYRIDFFQRLYQVFGDDFSVYYSPTEMGVLTNQNHDYSWAKPIGPVSRPFSGIEWQSGALRVAIRRGDVVVVCGAPRTISTLAVLLVARAKGAKTVWWGQYWSANSTELRRKIRMSISTMADYLLFYTDQEVSEFQSENKNDRAVGALNNGISISEIEKYRADYSQNDRIRNILFIGRLTKKANLYLLFQAMADERLANFTVHIIGEGEEEIPLRRLAKKLNIDNNIIWHGGISDERKIADIANICSVFVYPGQVGLSLIHAMAYGIPCIVHSSVKRHMPEIAAFRERVTGVTFKEGSAQSLTGSLLEIMSSEDTKRKYSENCIEITSKNFNTEAMAKRFKSFINHIGRVKV